MIELGNHSKSMELDQKYEEHKNAMFFISRQIVQFRIPPSISQKFCALQTLSEQLFFCNEPLGLFPDPIKIERILYRSNIYKRAPKGLFNLTKCYQVNHISKSRWGAIKFTKCSPKRNNNEKKQTCTIENTRMFEQPT